MKTSIKALSVVAGAAMLLASAAVRAESTYGYQTDPATAATATARINVSVTIPKLILLRVGPSGAYTSSTTAADTVALSAGLDSSGIPGGIGQAAFNTAGVGNSKASGWDGATAPGFAFTSTPASVLAAAWTNASNGGKLTGAVTTAFASTTMGLTAAKILVSSAPVAGGGLAHPGTSTAMGTPTNFSKNTVVSSNWTYSVDPAQLSSIGAGTDTEVLTYTAATL